MLPRRPRHPRLRRLDRQPAHAHQFVSPLGTVRDFQRIVRTPSASASSSHSASFARLVSAAKLWFPVNFAQAGPCTLCGVIRGRDRVVFPPLWVNSP